MDNNIFLILSNVVGLCNIICIILLSLRIPDNNNRPLIDESMYNGNFDKARWCLIINLIAVFLLNIFIQISDDNEVLHILSFICNIVALFTSLATIVIIAYTHSNYVKSSKLKQNSHYQATIVLGLFSGCIGAIITSLQCYQCRD